MRKRSPALAKQVDKSSTLHLINIVFLPQSTMKQQLDITTWNRKEHFEFFMQFDEPYHGVSVDVDCTVAYKTAKERGCSVWLYYFYQAIAAANITEAFKLRVEDGKVYVYDRVDGGSTIGRPNGTFGFGDFIYSPSFDEFLIGA